MLNCGVPCNSTAWRVKGRRERSRCLGKKLPGVEEVQRMVSKPTTSLTNLALSSTIRRLGGGIPASTGKHPVGVGWRHPVLIRMVSLRATSNFLICLLRHQAGATYSAALYATAKALMRSVDVFAPTRFLSNRRDGVVVRVSVSHR